MSYLVLARKYRPSTFEEVAGQPHITDILTNAVTTGRMGQAYLFCGPRGIGKTSCARILAKALNCEKGVTPSPCGVCPSCVSITQGNSFDVLEIDGASNRGIDEIRTIRENVKFAPSCGRYKIYIVDEVHMLTTEAFNALLKTLEEPPEHVKFIFATTDPYKLPATIISRCQRFDFRRISFKELCTALEEIARKEKISVDQDALYAIAKAAKGSFRDALSILDQIGGISGQRIQALDVCNMLGLVELDLVFKLAGALGAGDCREALMIFDDIVERGEDVKQLGKDLIGHFRNLMVIRLAGASVEKIREMGRLIDYPSEVKDAFLKQAQIFELPEILAAISIFIEAQEVSRVMELERVPMEIAFAKLVLALNRPTVAADDVPAGGVAGEEETLPRKPARVVGTLIKNKKGQVNAPSDPPDVLDGGPEPDAGAVADDTDSTAMDIPAVVDGALSLETIRAQWPALTHAVSRVRMSLATYLQEGFPCAFTDGRLTIGFTEEHSFFKESLEANDNLKIIEEVFRGHLGSALAVRYETRADAVPAMPENNSEVVRDVLEAFGGEIVNRWHNE